MCFFFTFLLVLWRILFDFLLYLLYNLIVDLFIGVLVVLDNFDRRMSFMLIFSYIIIWNLMVELLRMLDFLY